MIKEYTVVMAHGKNDIIQRVNELLKVGWQLQGGICYEAGGLFQAMYREIEKKGESGYESH